MKILGIILIAIGLVDLFGSYADFDLWGGFVGIELPELLWTYSAYIEIAAAYFAFKFGKTPEETPQESEESNA